MKFSKLSISALLIFSIAVAPCLFGTSVNPVYASDSTAVVKTSAVLSSTSDAKVYGLFDQIIGGKNLLPSKIIIQKHNQYFSNPHKKPIKPPIKKPAKQKPDSNYWLPNNSSQNNSNNSSQNNTNTQTGLTAYEQEALNLLNADRAANGLPALKVNMDLVRLAENYAEDMITRDFFAHENPEGLSPFDRMKNAGISYRFAGENLAINSSVSAAQKAFMASTGHKANVLNDKFTQVGIGVKIHPNGSVYVVQEFIGL